MSGEEVLRTVTDPTEVRPLDPEGLSGYFQSFLRYFLSETFRTGGEVVLATRADLVDGILLGSDAERLGTVFARSDTTARALRARHPEWAVFSEHPGTGPRTPFLVYRGDPGAVAEDSRLVHPVRPAEEGDLAAVRALMDQVDGPVNPRAFDRMPWSTERGLLVHDQGRPVGVGWLSVIGSHARLHSLAVAPRYRRLGIGTDLVRARLWLARSLGVHEVTSEIAEENGASRRIAERLGMRPIGPMYLLAPAAPVVAPTPAVTSEAPRTPDSSSPSNR